MKELAGWALFVAVIAAVLLLSVGLFKTCYDEHRDNQFSVTTAIVSCSS